jgi:hypothetical protein
MGADFIDYIIADEFVIPEMSRITIRKGRLSAGLLSA